jgi:hypothetical protein
MKQFLLQIPLLAMTILPGAAQPASKHFAKPAGPASEPVYLSESALPKGWPTPGPFNQVTRKEYPAYRAAFTPSSSPNGGFWTLFKHIKRNGIPMTSPVEMTLKDESGGGMKMERMGFLYQSPEVGKSGADGEAVNVRDIPALSVLGKARAARLKSRRRARRSTRCSRRRSSRRRAIGCSATTARRCRGSSRLTNCRRFCSKCSRGHSRPLLTETPTLRPVVALGCVVDDAELQRGRR